MNARKAKHGGLLTFVFTLISLVYVFPIVLVVINSFKKKAYISRKPFAIPTDKMYVGLENYVNGIKKTGFVDAFWTSLFITVLSVAIIILCTSMCAWYISRVKNKFTTGLYFLCLFSMIVPFQMVMFTLSKLADMLHLGNPLGIVVVYLGFGAGLSVFMFCGFVKSIPLEIEEAAMIDGCSYPRIFWEIIIKNSKPALMTLVIFTFMNTWNDFLRPLIFLNSQENWTLSMGLAKFQGTYVTQWNQMMAGALITMLPILVVYIFAQKYFVQGIVMSGIKD